MFLIPKISTCRMRFCYLFIPYYLSCIHFICQGQTFFLHPYFVKRSGNFLSTTDPLLLFQFALPCVLLHLNFSFIHVLKLHCQQSVENIHIISLQIQFYRPIHKYSTHCTCIQAATLKIPLPLQPIYLATAGREERKKLRVISFCMQVISHTKVVSQEYLRGSNKRTTTHGYTCFV